MLQPDEKLPAVAAAPAPWSLTGRGWILIVKLPRTLLDDPRFVPTALRGRRHGQHAVVMAVDYASSPVGPYRELIYTPGRFDFPDGRRHSITCIYVSSMESVVNGRRNWGIPKDCCDFDVAHHADGCDSFSASHAGRPFAEIEMQARGPRLPFTTALVPGFLRTLSQLHGGQQFTYRPAAHGRIQRARVVRMAFDGKLFPDLSRGHVTACIAVPEFTMTFPAATVALATIVTERTACPTPTH